MFWRNVKARSAGAPVNKLGRKPARYDIPEDVELPAVSAFLVEVELQLSFIDGLVFAHFATSGIRGEVVMNCCQFAPSLVLYRCAAGLDQTKAAA